MKFLKVSLLFLAQLLKADELLTPSSDSSSGSLNIDPTQANSESSTNNNIGNPTDNSSDLNNQ